MTTAVQLRPPPLPATHYQVRPFTVDEYHSMIRAGVLGEDDPVELLEGYIVFKMARNPLHDELISIIQHVLGRALPEGWRVRNQCAVTLADSEPEPDLAVVAGAMGAYLQRHPTPSDIALIVEVAASSLARDREDKGRVYARAGIPAYWVINAVDSIIEVHTDPTGPAGEPQPAYRVRREFRSGDTVPLAVGGAQLGIPAAQLFG